MPSHDPITDPCCTHGVRYDTLEGCPTCYAEWMAYTAARDARRRAACHVEVHTCPACMGKGHVAVVEGR